MKLEDVEALEREVNQLRALYDSYFAGLEKREPRRKRDDISQKLRGFVADGSGRTTQISFRVNNLRSRYATFEAHWDRILRQMEEGTYKRDKLRAQRLLGKEDKAPPPVITAAAASVSDYRSLYNSYAAARARAKEPPVSYEAMVSSLQKQVPALIERLKCKGVEFKVVEKDGKAILKAFPIT